MDLRLYLFTRKLTYKAFGKIIGKSGRQVANIVARGTTRAGTAIDIEKATGGKVSRFEIYPELEYIENSQKRRQR